LDVGFHFPQADRDGLACFTVYEQTPTLESLLLLGSRHDRVSPKLDGLIDLVR
jgi:hypothetical protein